MPFVPASQNRPHFTEQEALQFHQGTKPGKLEIAATKPMATQRDLSLAYSPGVAVPVRKIAEDPSLAYDYTAKGNMVAVISNGTAILGLGNLGALASKPVMEGKSVLFKRFADVDSIAEEASNAANDARRSIDESIAQSRAAGGAIDTLGSAVELGAELASKIAATSGEQHEGVQQLKDALESLRVASDQNAEASRDLEGTGVNLKSLSEDLSKIVS